MVFLLYEKLRGKPRARMFVDVGGDTELLDATAVHDGDSVAHGQGFVLIVRDANERDPEAPLQLVKFDLELLAQFKVERAQRFVQQQDLRFVDDGAGQGDALLLAAGKLRGFAAGEGVDFDRFHHSLHNRCPYLQSISFLHLLDFH